MQEEFGLRIPATVTTGVVRSFFKGGGKKHKKEYKVLFLMLHFRKLFSQRGIRSFFLCSKFRGRGGFPLPREKFFFQESAWIPFCNFSLAEKIDLRHWYSACLQEIWYAKRTKNGFITKYFPWKIPWEKSRGGGTNPTDLDMKIFYRNNFLNTLNNISKNYENLRGVFRALLNLKIPSWNAP